MTIPKVPSPTGRVLAAALGLLFLAFGAAAQTVCMPQASGVPALSGGPNWWDMAAGEPQFWPRPDDPRWRGAFQHIPMPASASADHLTFRALRSASDLFLQWRITVDPLLDQQERLWVAFSPGPGKEDVYIEIQPFNSAATDVVAEPPAAVALATRTTGNPFAGAGVLPAWLATATTQTRVWRSVAENSWTVNMRVPITAVADAGLNLDPSFSFWFEVRVSHPMMSTVYYQYPNGLDHLTVETNPTTAGWQLARRDVAPTTAGCIRGVSLTVADVGTVPAGGSCANMATVLSSEIKLLDGGSPDTNTFCARPLNETGGTIAAGDVDATFRTANWGTQPDWNDVPNPLNTLWTTINPTPATGGAITNTNKGALSADWALTAAEVCSFSPQPPGFDCSAFPAPTRRRHQCMLVELGGAAGVTFSTSSVYRNMDFVNASRFEREAEVSVVGLAPRPVPEPRREVFLYVQTDNMPLRLVPPIVEGEDPDDRPRPAVAGATVSSGHKVEPLPKTPYEELRETSPTYQVHAFYDTGRTETFNDEKVRILAPQTSFGYFVDHEGSLYGWRHELQGAEQVSADFPHYYVIPVPENGTATVTTVIEALERDPGDEGFGPAGGQGGRRRWSLSLHAGVNDPRGDAGNFLDGDTSYGADLQYHFLPALALELYYGVDDFGGAGVFIDEIEHLSLNLKGYFGSGAVRPFLLGGVGRYDLTPGGDPEKGYDAGAGLQFNLSSVLALEAEGRYHWVDLGPNRFEFITGHGVLRISF